MHLINQPTTSRLVQATFLFPEADRCTFNYYQPRKLLFAFISATTTTTSSPQFRVPDVIRLIYTPGDTLSRPHSDPVILFGSSRAKEKKEEDHQAHPSTDEWSEPKNLEWNGQLNDVPFSFPSSPPPAPCSLSMHAKIHLINNLTCCCPTPR